MTNSEKRPRRWFCIVPRNFALLEISYGVIAAALVLGSRFDHLEPAWLWKFVFVGVVDSQIFLIVLWQVFGRPSWWARILIPVTAIAAYNAAWYCYGSGGLISYSAAFHHAEFGIDLALAALAARLFGAQISVGLENDPEPLAKRGRGRNQAVLRTLGVGLLFAIGWIAASIYPGTMTPITICWTSLSCLAVFAFLDDSRRVSRSIFLILVTVLFDVDCMLLYWTLGSPNWFTIRFGLLLLSLIPPLWILREQGTRIRWARASFNDRTAVA